MQVWNSRANLPLRQGVGRSGLLSPVMVNLKCSKVPVVSFWLMLVVLVLVNGIGVMLRRVNPTPVGIFVLQTSII